MRRKVVVTDVEPRVLAYAPHRLQYTKRPHDDSSRGGRVIRDGQDRRVERLPVVVETSAQVDEGRQPRDAKCDVDDAKSPRTSEGVGDDHAHFHSCDLAQPVTKARGAGIG